MSVIGTGLAYRTQATRLMDKVSELETRRDSENQMIDQAKKSQQGSLAGTGAALGFMAGGPAGMAIGAGIGFLAGEFL